MTAQASRVNGRNNRDRQCASAPIAALPNVPPVRKPLCFLLALDDATQRRRSAQIAGASLRQRRGGGRRLVTASLGLRGLAAVLLHQIAFPRGSERESGVGDAIGGMRSFAAVMDADCIGHDEILY
jgi:hypothetical protein